MPFRSGKSQKVISENIREYEHGPSFRKIEERHGKEKAEKVAEAAAESNARKTGFRSRRKGGKKEE